MNPREKQYILHNADKKTPAQMAKDLGLKERKIRKFLEDNKCKPTADALPYQSLEYTPRKMQLSGLMSIVIISLFAFIAYSNSLSNTFVYDDEHHIVENTVIRDLSNIPLMFTHDLTYFSGQHRGRFYRPIESVTFAVDYFLWGLQPFGYHLTNMLLHLLAAILLFFFARYIFHDVIQALAVSLIWVVHPINTEAVTYVSGRADPISAIFLLGMVIAQYRSWQTSQRMKPLYYFVMLIFFMSALLTKEGSVIFLFLLMLFEYCFRKRGDGVEGLPKKILFYAGFFVIIFLWYIIRNKIASPAAGVEVIPSLSARLIILPRIVFDYLRLSFLPMSLHMDYQLPYPDSILKPFYFEPLIPMAAVGLLAIICWYKRNASRIWMIVLFGLAWFFVALLPYLNIAFPLNASFAEHWLYIAEMGLLLSVVTAIFALPLANSVRSVLMGILVFIIAAFSIMTIKQNLVWKDGISLYSYTLKHSPYSARICNNLGAEYERRGDFKKAKELFEQALKINPDYAPAKENLQGMTGVYE